MGKKCHRGMLRRKERLKHKKSLCYLFRVFKALSLILLLFWTQIAVAQCAVAAFSHLGNAQQVHFLAGGSVHPWTHCSSFSLCFQVRTSCANPLMAPNIFIKCQLPTVQLWSVPITLSSPCWRVLTR